MTMPSSPDPDVPFDPAALRLALADNPVLARELLARAQRRHLASFVALAFQQVVPDDTFQPNWHIEAICWHLEEAAAGRLTRLIITLLPRSLKSICVSVALPAWLLGHHPGLNIINVSYSDTLATRFHNDTRALMRSAPYQALFPLTRIDPHKDSQSELMTTRRGSRLATSIGGTLTGRGGDLLIIDDPIKPGDALSEPKRQGVNDWYDHTLYSRLNDKEKGVIILVMQRVHQGDLAGHLLDQGVWTHLNLPAIAEANERIRIGAKRIYHRRAGEALHAARESLESLATTQRSMGAYDYAAQYQQQPVPPGGAMIDPAWLPRYSGLPRPASGQILVQSWDTATKVNELASYSVAITALIDKSGIYILDVCRERLDFPSLRRRALAKAGEHNPRVILIEDKSSGTALIQELKRDGHNVIGITPEGDKIMRMHGQSAQIEAGRVLLPERAPWLDTFLTEIAAFPGSAHDDQVDALSQLLIWNEERTRRTARVLTMRW